MTMQPSRLCIRVISITMGMLGFLGFGLATNWMAALALFFMLWANNLGISNDRSQ